MTKINNTQQHHRFQDITGMKFGRWLVLSYSHKDETRESIWLCRCDCSVERLVRRGSLKSKKSVSCGCFKSEKTIARNIKYEKSVNNYSITSSPEYRAWQYMKTRCYNKNCETYKNWGGRGITICDRWLESFENFYADMGDRPSKGHSIDRKNNNGNYEPDNCRWATKKEQGRNTRQNVYVEYDGEKILLIDLCERFNMTFPMARRRLKEGKTLNVALKIS